MAHTQDSRVAFVGLNAEDKHPAATAFLLRFPIPYPSIVVPIGTFRDRRPFVE